MKEFIKNFIERNKPIFTIGIATLILFVGIIIYYRLKPHKETGLTKVGNESTFNVVEEENANTQDLSQVAETQPSVSIEQSLDEKVGILDIEFKAIMFSFRAVTRAFSSMIGPLAVFIKIANGFISLN